MMSDLETYIVSVERVREYSELESEADWETREIERRPEPEWPTEGKVVFKHYSTRSLF